MKIFKKIQDKVDRRYIRNVQKQHVREFKEATKEGRKEIIKRVINIDISSIFPVDGDTRSDINIRLYFGAFNPFVYMINRGE